MKLLKKISEISGLTSREISEIIFRLKDTIHESFEIVPRTITGVKKTNFVTLIQTIFYQINITFKEIGNWKKIG